MGAITCSATAPINAIRRGSPFGSLRRERRSRRVRAWR
jgi:hypothetical protein